jgi:HSP20 family protein
MVTVKEAPRTRNAEAQAPKKEMAPTMKEHKGLPTPFTLMGRFAEEMEQLFEEFGLEPMGFMPRLLGRGRELMGGEAESVPAEWRPRVEMFEREGQFVVHADLPGLAPEDVKVEVTHDHLTLQGERKEEKKEEREGAYYGECHYGAFYRTIPLPEGVDTTHATAEFRKGVLEVVMPKATPAETKARRLEVREAN